MAKYMSQIPPEPKPKAGPRKSKPKPTKAKKIDFGPAVPTPKRASKQERTGMEMPKKVKPKRSFDDAVRTQNNQREMSKRTPKAKEIAMGTMGSTEVQAQARQQRLVADMRKRMMLRKDKKSN